ncbi:general secretion pathway protein GspM [Pseudomonas lurida]|jgi:general secretion pathway protein M|uniref:Type II secretion system protein GspM n=1 Tax=Pseudomonas quebecensis TaxID=2995174 RepID=A0ABY6QLU5_9PSED|nr:MULTISPECIES: type II secretion system protein GspM [Pseudomonas]MBA1296158.1 general secretion pathway protein GspM [Pseudomonas lurida]MCP1511799.1 general secretion pathway protein M [Pseudomonas rhodesiae]MCX4063774.1 type II secretion system protein GspM [Pseudomonas quebecensis]MDF9770628.1 general secretion pathway protein M [Pseudomonas rhodesiae]UZW20340.1 type II secretion system protein GspM [Pseudomonas quebecensis]
MRRPLTPRERRGAALIGLAVVLGAVYWLLIDSWFAGPLRAMSEQAEQLREQQQRYAGVLRQGDSLRQQLEQARQDPASSTSLLPGDDPSAVAADLMQRIADLINSRATVGGGCSLTQRMPITPQQDDSEPYRQVKVSLTLNCAIEPLTAIVHELEYQRPFLFVDEMSIRRAPNAPVSGGAGKLVVHLLVRGYLQPAGARQVQP